MRVKRNVSSGTDFFRKLYFFPAVSDVEQTEWYFDRNFLCSVVKTAFWVSRGPFWEKLRFFPNFLPENFWTFVLRKRIFWKLCTFLKSYWVIDLKVFRVLAKEFREVLAKLHSSSLVGHFDIFLENLKFSLSSSDYEQKRCWAKGEKISAALSITQSYCAEDTSEGK